MLCVAVVPKLFLTRHDRAAHLNGPDSPHLLQVRPASVGLGGAQLKSSALYHQGHFCRSTASLSWPKDAEAPGTGPAGASSHS